jgi:predicted porin
MQKTLAITAVVVVVIALAAASSLFVLGAVTGSYQTCGKVNQAELRAAGASDYGKKLEKLARCGR